MAVAVVDTSVLVAATDADDRHHDVASRILEGVDRGTLPTGRVTEYTVLETLNWIHGRKRHETGVEFHARLRESAGFEIVRLADADFRRATELFETYAGLAFGDAAIAAYAERADVTYCYAFDDDFDAVEELGRLATPENPFG